MKKLCVLLTLLLFTFSLTANDDVNLQALKEWLATKRAITIDERGGALSISGDIHVEYLALSEQLNGVKNIGYRSYHPLIPEDQFDIEFNLMLDYRSDRTWGSVKVEFDNNAGILTGTFNHLFLERAFFGIRLFDTDNSTTELEFGRSFLTYNFDSQIQFGSIMDGILLKYNRSSAHFGDFYLLAAPFIVSEILTQISFVMETGLLNIWNTGFYAKYSLIDWNTKNYADDRLDRANSFINSQFILGYRFKAPFFDAVTIVYAAYLINTAAKKYEILNNQKDNMAGYIGITMGELRKKHDWSFSTSFQIVEPQAIPYLDFNGIGIYNPENIGLYTIAGNKEGAATLRETAVANGNYYGLVASFLYAIENNLTLSQRFAFSRPYVHLPQKFHFQAYKLELIYAW